MANRRLNSAKAGLDGSPVPPEKEVTRSLVPLASLSLRVDHQGRRLISDEIFELPAEVLERHVDGGGKFCQLVRIFKIIPAQPDHVTASDGVTDRACVHEANSGAAGVSIDE